MTTWMMIVLVAVLADHLVFAHSSYSGCKYKLAEGFGIAVTAVAALTGMVCSLLDSAILSPMELTYAAAIVYVIVAAVMVQCVELISQAVAPQFYAQCREFYPLLMTNAAVFGVALSMNSGDGSFFSGLYMGVAYLVVSVLLVGLEERLDEKALPISMKGVPVMILTVALMAMAFMGLSSIL